MDRAGEMQMNLIAKLIQSRPDLKRCYEMGRDCALNGANEINCHFSLFGSPEHTRAWELGKRFDELDGCNETITP